MFARNLEFEYYLKLRVAIHSVHLQTLSPYGALSIPENIN